MKTKMKYLVVYISFILASLIYAKEATAQQIAVSYQVFYDQLSAYGQWVNYPNYGYVWLPDVGPDFTPYSTNGYWIMTNYGMTWVSDYSWGWAPFHYGRWEFDNFYGWFWVPDTEWGPAWVTWRSSRGYYGWTPMRPGISITVSFGSHYHSHDHWIFVRDRDIDRRDLHRYCVDRRYYGPIIRNSVVINNTYIDNSSHTTYVAGPNRRELQKNLGRNVRTARIYENNRPGQQLRNNQLHIYRPRISKNINGRKEITPGRVTRITDIKRISDRNTYENKRKTYESNNNIRNQHNSQQKITENNNIRRKQETTYQSDNNVRKNQQTINQNNNNRQREQQTKVIQNSRNNNSNIKSTRTKSNVSKSTSVNHSNNNKTDNQRKSNSVNSNGRRR